MLLQIISSISITAITIVIVLCYLDIRKVFEKYKMKTDAEIQSTIQDIVESSIAHGCTFAEQWGEKVKKESKNKIQNIGNTKMHKAIEYAINDMNKHGIVYLTEKEVQDRIEAFLGISTMNMSFIPNGIFPMEDDDNENSFDFRND